MLECYSYGAGMVFGKEDRMSICGEEEGTLD
jgi:hypothetical protein